MNKLKFILPLILATITLVTYRPIEAQASTTTITPNILLNQEHQRENGIINNNVNFNTTQKITVPYGATITFNNSFWTEIVLFNDNTYIDVYLTNNHPNTNFTKVGNTFTLPNNVNTIAINAVSISSFGFTAVSDSNFQTLTVSYPTPAPAEPEAPTIDFSTQSLVASYTITNDLDPDPDWFRYKLDITFTQPLAVIMRTKAGTQDYSDAPDYPTIQTTHTFFIESKLSATGHDKLELFIDNVHFGDVPQTGWQGDYSWNP